MEILGKKGSAMQRKSKLTIATARSARVLAQRQFTRRQVLAEIAERMRSPTSGIEDWAWSLPPGPTKCQGDRANPRMIKRTAGVRATAAFPDGS